MYCFFFYCYGDHRDLHSFPTRRSSDLVEDQAGGRDDRRPGDFGRVELGPRVMVRDRLAVIMIAVREDRKSTRLNSSHGYISYAVFCLKKKKTKNRTIMRRTNQPRA